MPCTTTALSLRSRAKGAADCMPDRASRRKATQGSVGARFASRQAGELLPGTIEHRFRDARPGRASSVSGRYSLGSQQLQSGPPRSRASGAQSWPPVVVAVAALAGAPAGRQLSVRLELPEANGVSRLCCSRSCPFLVSMPDTPDDRQSGRLSSSGTIWRGRIGSPLRALPVSAPEADTRRSIPHVGSRARRDEIHGARRRRSTGCPEGLAFPSDRRRSHDRPRSGSRRLRGFFYGRCPELSHDLGRGSARSSTSPRRSKGIAAVATPYTGCLGDRPRVLAIPATWLPLRLGDLSRHRRSRVLIARCGVALLAHGPSHPSRALRMALVFAAVLLPVFTFEDMANITNTIWVLTFAVFWALVRVPRRQAQSPSAWQSRSSASCHRARRWCSCRWRPTSFGPVATT